MNKLTVCAVVISGAFATQVMANPVAVQITAQNQAVCEVKGSALQLTVGSAATTDSAASTQLTMKCNDRQGATVKLISQEGGLESDDAEDFAIAYKATFTPDGLEPLVLDAPGGFGTNNFESAPKSYAGSEALATGIDTTLEVNNTGTAVWAGGYSDTITISITANN
ncbi:MAG: hypothetical protein HWE27_13585 [Gammaproteobacteria bacterium]|nr:hypothetical protein [Gammaproteobacteria bacterium]